MSALRKVQLLGYPEPQAVLDQFWTKAQGKSEATRIQLAQHCWHEWQQLRHPAALFPGIPERQDFWYLVQVFALNRHLGSDGQPQHFNFSLPTELQFFTFTQAADSETLLQLSAPKELPGLKLDPHKFSLRFVRYDEALRLSLANLEISPCYLDGLRFTSDQQKFALFNKGLKSEDSRFIDTWPQDRVHNLLAATIVVELKS